MLNHCSLVISSSPQTKLKPCFSTGTVHAGKAPRRFKLGLCHPSARSGGNRARSKTFPHPACLKRKVWGSATLAEELEVG